MSEIATQRAELAKLDYSAQALDTTVADVLAKLYSVWDDVTPEDQDAIQSRRRALASALTKSSSPEEAEQLLVAFLRALEVMDSVIRMAYAELRRGKQTQTFRSAGRGANPTLLDALAAAPATGGDPLLDTGESLPYHTKVDFPTSIASRDESVHPLVVRLVINKPAQSRADVLLALPFVDENTPELVEVHLNASGFAETTGVNRRTLVVYKGEDSDPAIFLLKLLDKSSGDKELRLDFYHLGYPIGTATFKTEVTLFHTGAPGGAVRTPGGRPALRPPQSLLLGNRPTLPAAPFPEPAPLNLGTAALVAGVDGLQFVAPSTLRPDVILRVVRDGDDKTLHFTLFSPQSKIGYREKAMGSVVLQKLKDPTILLNDYFVGLDQLARNATETLGDAEAQDYIATTKGMGSDLYDQLFPDELKAEYWQLKELREAGVIQTLLILSDEPWIPWESIYPFDDEHGADDFLGAAWHLTRWQAGRGLNPHLNVQTAQMIAPELDLSFVKEESAYFARLADAPQPIKVSAPITTRQLFLDQVQAGGVQLLHFATHGNFNSQNADRSPIHMEGGETITPVDLSKPRTQGIRRERPLVFLNACHGGKLEFTLTGMGGWAERVVNHVAATAFVGAYWEINDELASLFSSTFYDALRNRATLGAAFHQARLTVRAQSPANPTWLAYTLYGDPNARITWGSE